MTVLFKTAHVIWDGAEPCRLEAAPGIVAGIVCLFVTFAILSRRRGRGGRRRRGQGRTCLKSNDPTDGWGKTPF